MRRPLLPLAALLIALALAPAAARAGTLSMSGTTITYQAAPGEANFVTVNWGNVGAGPDFIPVLDDHAPITAVPPCVSDDVGARCEPAGTNPTWIVRLGD